MPFGGRRSCSRPTASHRPSTPNAAARGLTTIDATCPLVTKVHAQAIRYAAEGFTVILVGHAGHEEVVGTMGEAPDHVVLVQTVEDAERLELPDTDRIAYSTQTTLSVDETADIIAVLRRRFPQLRAPAKSDICYATTNRQRAVQARCSPQLDLLLVIGSRNCSNSNRLVEVGRAGGVESHLIDDETEIVEPGSSDARPSGITSGASAPESLVTAGLRLVPRERRHRHPPVRGAARGRRVQAADRAAQGAELVAA